MAGALEQYVSNVQNMSASGQFSALVDLTRNMVTLGTLKAQQQLHLDNALQTLDLLQHSIGILAILDAKLSTVNSENGLEIVLAQATEFANGCNGEQVRYVAHLYAQLFHQFTDMFLRKEEPWRGIQLLTAAIARIQVCPTQLTSLHSDLCCLCLKAKIFKPALQFLDNDITDIIKEVSPYNPHFDSKYFLQYYYYGGMIYAALKQFDRSLYFFEVALTTPAIAVSAIMVEAYKKYVLVSLIEHGKLQNLPPYKSAVINRFIKPSCQPYLDLSKMVDNLHYPRSLEDFANKNAATFAADNNAGLVKQVIKAQLKRIIQRLTKTFLTLSLADVASQCHLADAAEAEQHILAMIAANEISASIDKEKGMVQFEDAPDSLTVHESATMLDEQLEDCLRMQGMLNKLDTETLLNPQYVSKCSKLQGGSSAYGASLPIVHDDEGVSVGSALMPGFSDMMAAN